MIKCGANYCLCLIIGSVRITYFIISSGFDRFLDCLTPEYFTGSFGFYNSDVCIFCLIPLLSISFLDFSNLLADRELTSNKICEFTEMLDLLNFLLLSTVHWS